MNVIESHSRVGELRWGGEMAGRTIDMQSHFPKCCSNLECAMGVAIKLMPQNPLDSTGKHW